MSDDSGFEGGDSSPTGPTPARNDKCQRVPKYPSSCSYPASTRQQLLRCSLNPVIEAASPALWKLSIHRGKAEERLHHDPEGGRNSRAVTKMKIGTLILTLSFRAGGGMAGEESPFVWATTQASRQEIPRPPAARPLGMTNVSACRNTRPAARTPAARRRSASSALRRHRDKSRRLV